MNGTEGEISVRGWYSCLRLAFAVSDRTFSGLSTKYHAVPTYRQYPPTGTQKKKLKLLAWNNVCCIGKFVPSDIITLLF
ncbi:Uncharacterized protein HZ326_28779 [Fusarium oxysporum f. sp. albedinis]|nr:Uncharacterized protein HZ326_28779 [Fusarium oxysporum f. sp. albedinis]